MLCDVISVVTEFMVSIARTQSIQQPHCFQCLVGIKGHMYKRVNTRVECCWSHAWLSFKRSKGVMKLNGNIECKFQSKNAHQTSLI